MSDAKVQSCDDFGCQAKVVCVFFLIDTKSSFLIAVCRQTEETALQEAFGTMIARLWIDLSAEMSHVTSEFHLLSSDFVWVSRSFFFAACLASHSLFLHPVAIRGSSLSSEMGHHCDGGRRIEAWKKRRPANVPAIQKAGSDSEQEKIEGAQNVGRCQEWYCQRHKSQSVCRVVGLVDAKAELDVLSSPKRADAHKQCC